MNTNDAYVKVEGIIRDNEGITKMGIIREAWKVGIGYRLGSHLSKKDLLVVTCKPKHANTVVTSGCQISITQKRARSAGLNIGIRSPQNSN